MVNLAKLSAFRSDIEATRRHHGAAWLPTYLRALGLLRRAFSPKEIFLWDLLDPRHDANALSRFVSKEEFLAFQAAHSPTSYAVVLEDKELFYRFSASIGLPIPETVAFLSRTSAWFPDGQTSCDGPALGERLGGLQGVELIIKPVDGVYGLGVKALTVQSDSLLDEDRHLSVKDLLDQLEEGRRYILQRRLANHSAIEELLGFKTLQALRVVTVLPKHPCERGRVMSVAMRLNAEEGVVNNFDYGRNGNIRAKVDVGSGRIVRAVRAAATGFGLEDVDRVIRTGVPLIGWEVPLWREMIDLIERKAACFYPIRMVGWDVAITPNGPAVIEGNFWFDPGDNAFGEVRQFMQTIDIQN